MSVSPSPAVSGDLARLLEIEERLQRDLAAAQAEAADMIRRAEDEANAERRAAMDRVHEAQEAARQRWADTSAKACAAIKADTVAMVERLDAMPTERLEALAGHVVAVVVGRAP